jgi:Mn-containing catalase
LSVGDINGKIDGEERGLQDSAPKATTSPGDDTIGKKAAKGVKAGNGKAATVKRAR